MVHFDAKIGNNCRILPNVMIGSKFANGIPDAEPPVIGDNVFIGTGAVVIGRIHTVSYTHLTLPTKRIV